MVIIFRNNSDDGLQDQPMIRSLSQRGGGAVRVQITPTTSMIKTVVTNHSGHNLAAERGQIGIHGTSSLTI